MRAVILYNTSWYVYLMRRNLVRALKDRGCEVTVAAPRDDYTERVCQLGVDYIPIEMSPRGTNLVNEAKTIAQIFKLLRKIRPDFVLSYTIKCNLYAGLCNGVFGFSQIANVSGLGEGFDSAGVLNHTVRNLYRLGLKRAHRVFFQNPDDRHMCIRQGLVSAPSSVLLPGSGVDLTRFVPSPPEPRERRVFLMFGRLLPRKGFYRFIKAARQLRSIYGYRVEFQILGGADHNRLESVQLLAHIEQASREGIVTYLPPTDEVLPILRNADVVVLPSTYNEGVPRSLLEALACAKPIITTDWKGCRETVIDHLNGRLVRAEDDDSFRGAVEALITESSDGLRTMGINSRRIAEERFDERLVLNAYLSAMGLPIEIEVVPERRVAA